MDKKQTAIRKLRLKAQYLQAKLLYNEYGGPAYECIDDADKLERLCWQIGKLAKPINCNAKWRKRMRFQMRQLRYQLALAA